MRCSVVTVHGIRDNSKTAWRREDGSRWISDTLFKGRPVREVDYSYDIDEDARLYESEGIEFHAKNLIEQFSQFRHPIGVRYEDVIKFPSLFNDRNCRQRKPIPSFGSAMI